MPALEHLKTGYTEVWISAPVVPLIQFADRVRPISSLEQLWIPKLSDFDEVISWYGSNREDFRQAALAYQPRSTFLAALPDPKWKESATDFFLQQVSAPKGLLPRIKVVAASQRQSLVIHPFSGSLAKNWPLARFQALAANFPLEVEWTSGPEEPLVPAVRFDSLLELAVWMRGAACYLGNDSGISHLAAAIGLPCVVLFGPSDRTVWAPRGDNVTILRFNGLDAKAPGNPSSPDSRFL